MPGGGSLLMAAVELAPGADASELATAVAAAVRRRLSAHPEREGTFRRLGGRVTLAVEPGETTTLRFTGDRLRVHAGLAGIPDVLLRGPAREVGGLLGLDLPPGPRGRWGLASALGAAAVGRLRVHGALAGLPLLARLRRILAPG